VIKIRKYIYTDRYIFEKLVKFNYEEKKKTPPDPEKIISTIAFFNGVPQCGNIYIIQYKEEIIGYAIVLNLWNSYNAKISYLIDDFFVLKNYRKYTPELNLIEFLLTHENIHGIGIKPEKFKSISKNIIKTLKFEIDKEKLFVKIKNV